MHNSTTASLYLGISIFSSSPFTKEDGDGVVDVDVDVGVSLTDDDGVSTTPSNVGSNKPSTDSASLLPISLELKLLCDQFSLWYLWWKMN